MKESKYMDKASIIPDANTSELFSRAGYRFREVFCPKCKRKFMWQEDSEWMEYYYILNTTGEKARQATCTTCSTKLAVFDGVLNGVDPSGRDELIHIREYGV